MNNPGGTLRDRATSGPVRSKALLLALIAAIVLAVGAAPARASSAIEGVWSFNGGKVAIRAQPNGTFAGTVVAPTRFSECFHPVGERMWTEIRQQPDGSYWGLHQWYFANSVECVPNPEPGLTAWRVVTGADGSKALEVCFSSPGSQSQPKIPTGGQPSGSTFGCSTSARISAAPTLKAADASKYILLPGGGCLTRSKLRIRVLEPKNNPLRKVSATLRSGRVHRRARIKRRSGSFLATLNLRGLSARPFTVSIRLTTVLGDHLSRTRKYRRCSVKKPHGKHHKKSSSGRSSSGDA
jgi:hypothetical protein